MAHVAHAVNKEKKGDARGAGTEKENEMMQQSTFAHTATHTSGQRGRGGIGDEGKEEEKENRNDKKESSAAQSPISFSLEKKTEDCTSPFHISWT